MRTFSTGPDQDTSPGRPDPVLMCPPTYFTVAYEINPWMSADEPVDTDLACRQWRELVATYHRLGVTVELIEPEPGLPDMVFAANAAVVVDGRALVARFRHRERRGEQDAYARWFEARGLHGVDRARHRNEGQGDVVAVGDVVLAGHGPRTTRAAHREIAAWSGREVVSLRLVDPRYYHLDTALFAVGETVAYLPGAFDDASRRILRRRFPDALIADDADAAVLGLNAVVMGDAVVLPAGTDRLGAALRARGRRTAEVDLSELRKAGGSAKCCTLVLDGVTEPAGDDRAAGWGPRRSGRADDPSGRITAAPGPPGHPGMRGTAAPHPRGEPEARPSAAADRRDGSTTAPPATSSRPPATTGSAP